MPDIILVVHDVRSTHNVGSLLRTADGLGVNKVYISGYTPYPIEKNDSRLPHIADKVNRQIRKTALGAEKSVKWQHQQDIKQIIIDLKRQKFYIAALEQSPTSSSLTNFKAPGKIAIIIGNEIEGLGPEVLKVVDKILEIPMLGKKESFNVAQAAAMALYHIRNFN